MAQVLIKEASATFQRCK